MFFWDLDGTIIDVSDRYYNLYKDIINDAGVDAIGKEAYWRAKCEAMPENEILKISGADAVFQNYHAKRISLIESEYYLSFDRLHEGIIPVLEYLSARFILVLVTLRSSPNQLNNELQRLSLKQYFTDTLSSGNQQSPRWQTKYTLIQEYMLIKKGSGHFMIGDTETDMKAGKELGLKTIAVLNGIRTRRRLLQANPDIMLNSAKDLLNPEFIQMFDRR
ncbi:MAG: HAD hydrolase-like protein [Desulfosalsimonadaceae bacterium]